MPSRTDLWMALWIGTAVFMLMHTVGVILFGWTSSHPTWWVTAIFLFGFLIVAAGDTE
jgi:uncharacterized protein YhhL (DUF1145 family)